MAPLVPPGMAGIERCRRKQACHRRGKEGVRGSGVRGKRVDGGGGAGRRWKVGGIGRQVVVSSSQGGEVMRALRQQIMPRCR